jgi:hypothetical protein
MDSNSSIINIKYLKTGLQYTKPNEKQFRDEDKSKSKYLRLEEFYNNGLVNNSQELFPKTPPAPTSRNPPNTIKHSQLVYKPSIEENLQKIADSDICKKEFYRKRSLKKNTT